MSKEKKIEIEIDEAQMPDTGEVIFPLKSENKPLTHKINAEQILPQEKRRYAGEITIESDMFKLDVAVMKKNAALDGQPPDLIKMEHAHIFRTYDSDGKKHIYSSPVGGHFHQIQYSDSADGVVRITGISKPLHMVKRTVNKQLKTVIEPLPEYFDDDHTHKILYVRSDSVSARQVNANAVQIISAEAIKGQKIPGVIG